MLTKNSQSLPGSLWGITAYYNPAGYQSRKDNYRKFRASSQRQGLKLIAVEAAFGNRPFELDDGDAEKIVRVRGGSVLWQKERLLNIGLRHLPDDCDKVAFLDADIIFEGDHWIEDARGQLEEHDVVQLFSTVMRLPRPGIFFDSETMPLGYHNGEKRHSLAYSVRVLGRDVLSLRDAPQGHCDPGFAWAFRRRFLSNLPLYDRMILGGGDSIIGYGLYGVRCPYLEPFATASMLKDQDEWSHRAFLLTQGGIGCLDSTIRHLWHGAVENRFHVRSKRILLRACFDPQKDIKLNKQGGWEWASFKPYLHWMVGLYFILRREDSGADGAAGWLALAIFDFRRFRRELQDQWKKVSFEICRAGGNWRVPPWRRK
jgi:hypothetical protein